MLSLELGLQLHYYPRGECIVADRGVLAPLPQLQFDSFCKSDATECEDNLTLAENNALFNQDSNSLSENGFLGNLRASH